MASSATRPPGAARPSSPKDWASQVKTDGNNLPSRLIVHGVEGVGKTSFAAHAPKPIFLMARGETGLETLIDSGRLSNVPHLPEVETWEDLRSAIQWLTDSEHDFKTLVIDTLNGVERLCHEHVCRRDYNSDWTKTGFLNYAQGFDTSLADWRELLCMLDALRAKKRMAVVGLCHTKVGTFKNPEGADYDRYQPDMHHKTWGLTHKWADHVLFANFYVDVSKDKGESRPKGKGGQDRVLYTVRHAAYDAKNRAGLPEVIELGQSASEGWNNFTTALKAAKGGK
jgi:hypothetical protein